MLLFAALPTDPPIPGIPGQPEDLPPTMPFVMNEDPGVVRIQGGGLEVSVGTDPFSFNVMRGGDGSPILATLPGTPFIGFAPVAFTRDYGFNWNRFYWGYRGYFSMTAPWARGMRVVRQWAEKDRVFFELATDRAGRGPILFIVGPFYQDAVRIAASAPPGPGSFGRIAFSFRAPEGECYAGFGERFNGINQRGKILECWSEEGGIEAGWLRLFMPRLAPEATVPGGQDATYAPIPFFVSSKGYGFLADVPEPTHFDMAASFSGAWRITAESNQLSAVIFAGPTPAKAIEQYTARTGRSLIPRPWVFAPWNQLIGYSQGGPLDVARLFRKKDIPSSVSFDWTSILPVESFRGREDSIKKNNAAFHALGFKRLGYIQPRVDQQKCAGLWKEAAEQGVLVRNLQGNSYVFPVLINLRHQNRYRISMIDFTHERADAWWHRRLDTLLDLGFDGCMYDFGEYVPPDAQFADGHDGHYWHNPYNLIYLRSAFRYFQQLDENPDDAIAPDYVYFHRSGYAGSQRWGWAMWSGDPEADWSVSDGLRAQVCAGINAGLSGMPYWGSDIGGFHAYLVPPPTVELALRWYEFGCFSGLMRDITAEEVRGGRIHILDKDDLACVARRYQKLRTQLVPYIIDAAREAHATGLPLMRASFLHFPDDPRCWETRSEYMFGPDLFVAPVLEPGARQRTLYLPSGRWIELWNRTEYDRARGAFLIGGLPIEGGRTITVDAPLDEIPLFVRMGAAIPMAAPEVDTWASGRPEQLLGIDFTRAQSLAHRLHAWVFADGASSTVLSDGSRLDIQTFSDGVRLSRTLDDSGSVELIVQIVWPVEMPPPTRIEVIGEVSPQGEVMIEKAHVDPLTLDPGTWTWSPERNALAFHGLPGWTQFCVR